MGVDKYYYSEHNKLARAINTIIVNRIRNIIGGLNTIAVVCGYILNFLG